ncbi:MAG: hypothetical protein O9341_19370 [Paucibacter sp.]|nr:hypothetical protein [Roseateles sp.]
MTITYSAYIPATGEITGKRITTASLELLALNTAPGEAWLLGEADHVAQRVELRPDDFGNAVVPVVVPYQPPAPPNSDWVTWAWSELQRRWLAVPTLAALKREANQPLLRQLDALDAKVVRPAGEIAEALVQGLAAPPDSLQRLQQLNAEKSQIRQQLQAIAASTSAEALASLDLPRIPLEPTP